MLRHFFPEYLNFAVGSPHNLYCLDINTGAIVWQQDVDPVSSSSSSATSNAAIGAAPETPRQAVCSGRSSPKPR